MKSSIFGQIITVARNAFREAVRDKVLYNLVIFVLLITGAAIILGDLTDGQEARTTVNLGLSAMLIFGAFISIFVGVGLVSKEIEKRTVYSVFAKPIGRATFITGKYFGLCLTIFVNVLLMGIGVTLALSYAGGTNLIASVWSAIFLIFLELTILTAVAITFSSFSSPALSALLTFFIFVIGHLSASLLDFANNLGGNATKIFCNFIYYILPNFSHFSFIANAANGQIPSATYFITAIIYAKIYAIILLVISSLIFSRRNFK